MRRGVAALAAAVAGVLALAVAVPPSAASWVDAEWVTAPVGALECGEAGAVNATAWGRMLTGALSGQQLEPVAAIDGITVTNTGVSSTASSAASTTDLGSDAWTSSLGLTALSGLAVGGGATLPFGTNAGAYTQYGRATSPGLSVGAAGAITSAGSGVVALETPGAATPRLATLQLSTLLDSSLPGLGVTTAQLADVRLRLGALAAIASYDSCGPLWRGAAPGSALVREYLVDDLGLDVTSSLVADAASAIRTSLTTLEATIDALDSATTTIPAALTAALSSALDLGVVSLGSVESLGLTVDVDLAPVRALVAGPLTDGVVTVDLSTGRVSADLEALFGAAYASSTGLNGLAPNTSVLTPPVLAAISTRVGRILTMFVTTTLRDAVLAAVQNASVSIAISAKLDVVVAGIPVLNALRLQTALAGTVGSFLGTAGHAAPTATTTVVVLPGLGLVTAAVNALLSSTLSTIVGAVLTNARAIGATVVTPLVATIDGLLTTALAGITGTTIPALVTSLSGVLTVLGSLLKVTVNARPDVAAGSVGPPTTAAVGRYFETALHVGVVNGSAASLASLFLANASVGPNTLR